MPETIHYNQTCGNALIEYCIIGALLLLPAIAMFQMVGANTGKLMAELRDDMRSKSAQAAATAQTIEASQRIAPIPTMQTDRQSNQVCYNVDACVEAPVVTGSGRLTETAGALGGQLTADYSNTLQQIADQLASDPLSDPGAIDLITQLALQGHTIANLQSTVATTCPPSQACYSNSLQEDLVSVARSGTDFDRALTALEAYRVNNPDSVPPSAMKLITSASSQITSIAASYNTISVGQVQGATDSSGATAVTWLPPTEAVLTTTQNSNTICANGGDTSQCVKPAP